MYDIARNIATLIPAKDTFILVDDEQFGVTVTAGRPAMPFLERDGQYWGPPPDDRTAITELERLRQAGARFIAFAWPAFWWLDHYAGFHQYLRTTFRRVWQSDDLIVFDVTRPHSGESS
jgi:hypothetical protein